MFRREVISVLFLLFTINVFSQKLGIEYRTAWDSLEIEHLIIFEKDGTVTIRYPLKHGVYLDSQLFNSDTFLFSNYGDTLHIKAISDSTTLKINDIEHRILNSKFILKPNNQLYDLNSGYTYVINRQTRKFKYGAIAFDDKLYLIRKRGSPLLRRKIKHIDPTDYETSILRGKPAIDKYGIKGINGVLEFKKK